MEMNLPTWTVPLLIFASVGLLSFVLATTLQDRRRVRDRFAATTSIGTGYAGTPLKQTTPSRFEIDAGQLGLDAGAQRKLRLALLRAGYFSPNAVVTYTLLRIALVLILPVGMYLLVQTRLGHLSGLIKLLIVGGSFLVAYYVGQAFLDRKQRLHEAQYRLFFPEFLDMLVVCVDAGLSLEAALERVAFEIDSSQRTFRTNLQLMMAEMRAGKSTIEALRHFADRLGLAEANSLVTLLQQSLELGTDVSASLSTYSDEMREKRMSRAEEKAMALPVKLTIPLALFILPTVFIAILTPAVVRIMTTFGK